MFVSSNEHMAQARRLLQAGFSANEVARELGVSRAAVGRWRRGEIEAFGPAVERDPWRPPNPGIYAYLLGMYLGDGHITLRPNGHTPFLRVSLDSAYPGIIDECQSAMVITSLGRRATVLTPNSSQVRIVQCTWARWPEALPQHGRGPKHKRPIVLAGWQREVVDAHPGAFVRGLIHSDGCRTINRFKVPLPSGRVKEYAYARYFFSNLSPDIRELFCTACAALGVQTTKSSHRNISVSQRKSVAVLEEIVGPKE
jgi:hypothetical protein